MNSFDLNLGQIVTLSGYVFVMLMLLQQLRIQSITDTFRLWFTNEETRRMRLRLADNAWDRTATIYRRHFRFTLLITSMVGFGASIAVFTSPDFLDALSGFFRNAKAPSTALFLVLFFTGILRMFFENTAEDAAEMPRALHQLGRSFFAPRRYRESPRLMDIMAVTETAAGGAWVAWFVVTVVVSVLAHMLETKVDVTQADAPGMLKALIAVWVATAGYFCWIYLGIYRQLTQKHQFSAWAARAFLGDVFSDRTPRQAVVIGHTGSGKSTFIRGEPTAANNFTKEILISMYADSAGISLCTAVDSPGENLGDHLLLVTRFRTDSTVLVLDGAQLDWAAALEAQVTADLFTAAGCSGFAIPGSHARSYLNAFRLVTNRSAGALDAKKIYRIRSFILFVNKGPAMGTEAIKLANAVIGAGKLRRLAEALGDRLGVAPADCCAAFANATITPQARELVALDPETRRLKLDGLSVAVPSAQTA